MPLQNRVLANGEIVADPARGLFMGNRGILHDENQKLGRARWRHKAWIICELIHKDWHREVMRPGNYTELFFLDEAVALAAGHRPCALCRRERFNSYRQSIGFTEKTKLLDEILHEERAVPRRFAHRAHKADIASLPNGAIFKDNLGYWLVMGQNIAPVTAAGYDEPEKRARSGRVTALTPKTSLKALSNGYRPVLHHTLKL